MPNDLDVSGHTLQSVAQTAEFEAICANENLAHIGRIQSAAVLLAFQVETDQLSHLSANIAQLNPNLMGDVPLTALVDWPATRWFGDEWTSTKHKVLASDEPVSVALISSNTIPVNGWECLGHRSGDSLVFEFFPGGERGPERGVLTLDAVLQRLRQARDVGDVAQAAVDAVHDATGYQRVMCYRFLEDWSGEVIAEATESSLQPRFVGLRFPASDIPAQARALYSTAPVRLIADISHDEVVVLSRGDPTHNQLDLSRCLARGVSLAHVEYLKGMAVRGSMSIALHVGGRLWGLIACHQLTPELLGRVGITVLLATARVIADLVQGRLLAFTERRHHHEGRYIAEEIDATFGIAGSDTNVLRGIRTALTALYENLDYDMILVANDRLALVIDSEGALTIDHPAATMAAEIFDLNYTQTGAWYYETRRIGEAYFGDRFSAALPEVVGLMLTQTPDSGATVVGFGLCESVSTVHWAGEPGTVRTGLADGRLVVRPRDSFERWSAEERGRSRFWQRGDREALRVLARAVDRSMELLNQAPIWR